MEHVILYLNITILIYFAALAGWYTLLMFSAIPDMVSSYQEGKYGNLDQLMKKCSVPISIIIPAYNEEKKILNSLYSILQNNYKNIRIIVVNDGSTDETLTILIKEFSLIEVPPVINQTLQAEAIRHYYQSELYKNLVVIDKEHGPAGNGADCHNAGLNATTTPIMMTLDADTVLEPDAIMLILYSFLSHKHCISAGGSIYVLNENQVQDGRLVTKNMPNQFIPAIQCVEYLRSFTYGRAGLNNFSGALCYPGAFTVFETKAIKDFGGFDASNYSYDAEMTIRFHHKMRHLKYPTHVRFVSNARAWTTVPDSLKSYWGQRNRWQRGMLLSARKHITMLFNPKYGIIGLISFPAYILFEVLGPVIEFFAYLILISTVYIGLASWSVVGWYIFLSWGYIMLLTLGTFYLSLITYNTFHRFTHLTRVLWLVTFEMFGFRQFRAFCCFYSTLQFMVNRLLGKNL